MNCAAFGFNNIFDKAQGVFMKIFTYLGELLETFHDTHEDIFWICAAAFILFVVVLFLKMFKYLILLIIIVVIVIVAILFFSNPK